MPKLNVLFLAPRLPLPADTGGKIRTLNILKQLAKQSDVHLVCFSFEKDDQAQAKQIEEMGISVSLVLMRPAGFLVKVMSVLFGVLPFSISKYNSKKMREVLAAILRSKPFHAVHVDHLHMAVYRDCFAEKVAFVDEHNVEYLILERCADIERAPLKKTLFFSQAKKMKKFEGRSAVKFSACFTVSPNDKVTLSRITDGMVPIHVIPNGVDTDYFRPGSAVSGEEESLVFTGSLDWFPNEDSVTYFCREILPAIRAKKPNVKFYVVGKGATDTLKKLAQDDSGIIVTGRVDDVRPYIAKSKIFVVPLRIGGGTRLKILEAMAMGKAVVSTTLGAEGIAYVENRDIILADRPQDFAKKVLSLLDDGKKRSELGTAARNFVLGWYDWDSIGHKLNTFYKEMIRV